MNSQAAIALTAAELEIVSSFRSSTHHGIQAMIDESLQPLKDDIAVMTGQHEQLSRQVEGISNRMNNVQESIGGIKVHLDRQATAHERKVERRQKWLMFLVRMVVGGGIARWLAQKAGFEWPEMHH